MTINFNNNKAYSGVSGAYSGKRRPGGGGPAPGACVAAQGLDLDVGTGTNNNSRFPAYGLYDYGASITLLRQSDIGAGEKRITGIGVEGSNSFTPGYTFDNQTVIMAHIPAATTAIPGGQWDISGSNIPGVSDITTVLGPFTYTPLQGYNVLTLDNFFCYNGVDNIVIIWENRDGSWQSGYGATETTYVGSNSANFRVGYRVQDNSYPTGQTFQNYNFVPNWRLEY